LEIIDNDVNVVLLGRRDRVCEVIQMPSGDGWKCDWVKSNLERHVMYIGGYRCGE